MDTVQILIELRARRERIDQAIAALEALEKTPAHRPTAKAAAKAASSASGTKPTAGKRVMSPESRQRMAEAQQKRWAKKKRAVKVVAKKAASVAPETEKPAKKAAKKAAPTSAKGGITAAGRKRMSDAAKARWAAKKAEPKTA